MANKTDVKIELMQQLNNNTKCHYSNKQIKQVLNHYANRLYKSKSVPFWFYSYNQGYFNTAIETLKKPVIEGR